MQTIRDLDPATETLIAEVPCTGPEELAGLVRAARAALTAWSATDQRERFARLEAAARGLVEAQDELAPLITREMGKPVGEARAEIRRFAGGAPEVMEEVAQALLPQVLRGPDCETRVEREPLGVVAAITPWNFPIGMPLELLLPALATGNTVVFKPSEHVPLCGARLAEIFQAHLPAGVLCLAQGAGDVGAALVASDVDMIGFIGSRETGKRIMQSASGGLKRLVLELGGKDPLIVFDDADLDAAAECAVQYALRNTGQVCCSVERVYVAAAVAARFEELVLEKARRWRHGSGFDAGVRMGPLVSPEQRRKVALHVRGAVAGGARLLLGGELPEGRGWFYPATVLADVPQDLEIARQETFGPVVSLCSFDGAEDEAVRLANDTSYGLGANVYTADLERGRRVARRIRSGQVGINRYLGGVGGAPWVGARQSGFGFIGGVDGHRQFTLPKSISTPLGRASA